MSRPINLAENLNQLLREKGWSRSKLAREARMNKTTLSNYYHGLIPRQIKCLVKVADALGVGLDELIFEKEVPTEVSNPIATPFLSIGSQYMPQAGRYEIVIKKID